VPDFRSAFQRANPQSLPFSLALSASSSILHLHHPILQLTLSPYSSDPWCIPHSHIDAITFIAIFSSSMGHYNTRRISLSLPSLGVQLPRAHRSPANLSASGDNPPAKRIKRSHTLSGTPLSQSFTPPPPPLPRHATSLAERPLHSAITAGVNTPPPSPHSHNGPKLDYEGINDDIVVGVLQQLEKTANRPHLIKELATVLMTSLKVVERYVHTRCKQRLLSSRSDCLALPYIPHLSALFFSRMLFRA